MPTVAESNNVVGFSKRTQQVLRNVERVAKGRWPVLILGETGTGKGVVARTIYGACPVGPFIAIDCSSLVGPLLESELFGHVRGAFTGAHVDKLGLIEAANGGTAFFDEIGELPFDVQAKLLRVLQEKEFRPVGSVQSRHSDFRLIAATNRNLLEEVERGRFRRDLYYRLNVVTIKLAPLRERRNDILVLTEHFLGRYGSGHKMTPEVLDAFLAYDWPGNVRELENCVQQMVAMNTGPLLGLSDIPDDLQNGLGLPSVGVAAYAGGAGSNVPVSEVFEDQMSFDTEDVGPILPLEEVERLHILRAMKAAKGDTSRAASMLGIGRATLYRKLHAYKIKK